MPIDEAARLPDARPVPPPKAQPSAARGVLSVSAATTLAQGLNIVVMPLLARHMGPAEFGLYGVFIAATGLLTQTVCLHYEYAIPLAASGRRARAIGALALLAALVTGVLAFGFVRLAPPHWLEWLGIEPIRPLAVLVPLVLWLTGAQLVLSAWLGRIGRFGAVGVSTVAQSAVTAVLQLWLVLSGHGMTGLVVGQLVGGVIGIAVGVRLALRPDRERPRVRRHRRPGRGRALWLRLGAAMARRYRAFPMYTVPSSLVNAASMQLPTILLFRLFDAAAAGQFGLAFRLLQVPARFIGGAIAQVMLPLVARLRREGDAGPLALSFACRVLAFCIPTFLTLAVATGLGIPLVFGEAWTTAGRFASVMSLWTGTLFCVQVLGVLVTVFERQAAELAVQIAYLVTVLIAAALGAWFDDPFVFVAALSALGALVLLSKVTWLASLGGAAPAEIVRALGREAAHAAPPAAALLLVAWATPGPLALGAACTIYFLIAHAWNWRVRRLYRL